MFKKIELYLVILLVVVAVGLFAMFYGYQEQKKFKELLISKDSFLKSCSNTGGHPYINFLEENDIMILDCVYYPTHPNNQEYNKALRCLDPKATERLFRVHDGSLVHICTKYLSLKGTPIR